MHLAIFSIIDDSYSDAAIAIDVCNSAISETMLVEKAEIASICS